jgi:hypothetical protein
MNDFYQEAEELDKKMQETTLNLESKLSKAVQINDEDEHDEEDELNITFEVTSNKLRSEVSHETSPDVSLLKSDSIINLDKFTIPQTRKTSSFNTNEFKIDVQET